MKIQTQAAPNVLLHMQQCDLQRLTICACCPYILPGVPLQNGVAVDTDAYSSLDSSSSVEDEQAERTQQAVEVVAEMQLTAEQLKVWYAQRCRKQRSLAVDTVLGECYRRALWLRLGSISGLTAAKHSKLQKAM